MSQTNSNKSFHNSSSNRPKNVTQALDGLLEAARRPSIDMQEDSVKPSDTEGYLPISNHYQESPTQRAYESTNSNKALFEDVNGEQHVAVFDEQVSDQILLRESLKQGESGQHQTTVSINRYNKNINNLAHVQNRKLPSSQGSRIQTFTRDLKGAEQQTETGNKAIIGKRQQKGTEESNQEYSEIRFLGAIGSAQDPNQHQVRGDKIKKFMADTNFSKDLYLNETTNGQTQQQTLLPSFKDEGKVINVKIGFHPKIVQPSKNYKNENERLDTFEKAVENHENQVTPSSSDSSSEDEVMQFGNSPAKQKIVIKDNIYNYSESTQKPILTQSSKRFQTGDKDHSTENDQSSVTNTSGVKIADDSLLMDVPVKLTCRQRTKQIWDSLIFGPQSQFKMKWDLIIIIISLWNALEIPIDFAFPELIEDKLGFEVLDHFTDILFGLDILINFRSAYMDPKTEEYVMDGTMITKNYLKQRFWIDLMATVPLESIAGIFMASDSKNLKFVSMIKLVRLLRLSKIIAYLKVNQSFKFSMKFVQLFMVLLLVIHVIGCLWFVVVKGTMSWYPPKDSGSSHTNFYDSGELNTYMILFYYAMQTIIGNDCLPTEDIQVIVATVIIFIGCVVLGLIIGEFSNIMSAMTKKANQANEELDMVTQTLITLKIPEEIQNRVLQYYDIVNTAKFVKNEEIYTILNLCISNTIKLFQTEHSIRKTGLFDQNNLTQIEKFAQNAKIKIFLPNDVIIKQGNLSDQFYFVIEGLLEVVLENRDFQYFDYFASKKYVQKVIEDQEGGEGEAATTEPSMARKNTMSKLDEEVHTENSPYNQDSAKGDQTNKFSLTLHRIDKKQVHPLSPTDEQEVTARELNKESGNNVISELMTTQGSSYGKLDQNYRVVNELKEGDYFGEISLLTRMRRTCSIFAVSQTICGVVSKDDFMDLVNTNADFSNKLHNKVNTYNDSQFKFLVTMLRNAFAFRTLNTQILRNILYVLQEFGYLKDTTVLKTGQKSQNIYFIKKGQVNVIVKDPTSDPNNPVTYHFATLNKGSCFNLVGSFLNKPAIFDYVIADHEAQLLVLDYVDFKKLTLRSESLNNVIQGVKAAYGKEHIKYDFGRMVFQSISELILAQKRKADFENLESPGIRGGLSREQSLYSLDRQSQASRYTTKIGGEATKQKKGQFQIIKKKFIEIYRQLIQDEFHISQLEVFKHIDATYDKLLGKNLNKDLMDMINHGAYKQSERAFNESMKKHMENALLELSLNKRKSVINKSSSNIMDDMNQSSPASRASSPMRRRATITYGQNASIDGILTEKDIEEGLKQAEGKVAVMGRKVIENNELINSLFHKLNNTESYSIEQIEEMKEKLREKLDVQIQKSKHIDELTAKQENRMNKLKTSLTQDILQDKSSNSQSKPKSVGKKSETPLATSNINQEDGVQNTIINSTFLRDLGENTSVNQLTEEAEQLQHPDDESSVIDNKSRSFNKSKELANQSFEARNKSIVQQSMIRNYHRNANNSHYHDRGLNATRGAANASLTISINASDVAKKLYERSSFTQEASSDQSHREYARMSEVDAHDLQAEELDEVDALRGQSEEDISFILDLNSSQVVKKQKELLKQRHGAALANSKMNNSLDYSLRDDM